MKAQIERSPGQVLEDKFPLPDKANRTSLARIQHCTQHTLIPKRKKHSSETYMRKLSGDGDVLLLSRPKFIHGLIFRALGYKQSIKLSNFDLEPLDAKC